VKKYQLLSIIFLITFGGGSLCNLLRQQPANDTIKEISTLKTVLPDAESFSDKTGVPPHYKAFKTNPATGEKELAGVAFLTTDIVPEIRGYAGPIKIMVGMDTHGTLIKIHILSHSETPAYVSTLGQFIEQFHSLDIKNTFHLGKDIDGMTRATVSSEAIVRAVEKSMKIVAVKILYLHVPKVNTPKVSIPLDQILLPIILFGIAVLGVILHNNILRWVSLLGGLGYLGLLKSTMVSVIQIANIGLLKFPIFTNCPLWYLLVGLTLVTTLALGMVYCGSLCPFASLQELLYNAFHKIFPKKIRLSKVVDRKARYLKYTILFAAVLISLILGNASAANFEPYILLFTAHTTQIGWVFLMVILTASVFHFRFWCKYLCPMGAFNGLLAKVSLLKIHLGDDCGGCQICAKVCPTEAIKMDAFNRPMIDYPECVLCNKCITKCPKGTMSLQKTSYAKTG